MAGDYPDLSGAFDTPVDSPSARAARDAAAKRLAAGEGGANRGYAPPDYYQAGGFDASDTAKGRAQTESPGFDTAAGAAENASVKNWNAQFASQIAGAGGVGTPDSVAALINNSTPGWGKQAGLDAVNKTGGAPRALNVGYGSTVVGSGSGERGQANNFVGVGNGPAPAGAAGVNPNPVGRAPSRLETMQGQLEALNARQKMYSESGTMRGRLQAVALSKQAQRLSSQLYTEQMAAHAMGSLNLETQKAYPDIAMAMGQLGRIDAGDIPGAYGVAAVRHGQNPSTPHMLSGYPSSLILGPTGRPTGRYNQITSQFEQADENGNFKALTALPGQR